MERESVVIYRSFIEAIRELPDEYRTEAYDALFALALNGENYNGANAIIKAVMLLVAPQIEANNKRYENGKKGGRPPKNNQTKTEAKPNENQTETETEPNVNDNVNDNVNKTDRLIQDRVDDVRAQIDYDWVSDVYGSADADLCVQVVAEMHNAEEPKAVCGVTYPPNLIRERAERINDGCVDIALNKIRGSTNAIGNIKEYLWAALFNAAAEIDMRYTNMAYSL